MLLNVNWEHRPVEIQLVDLWVIGFNFLLAIIDENGEVGQRRLYREHFGVAADLRADLIQHAFDSYVQRTQHAKIRRGQSVVVYQLDGPDRRRLTWQSFIIHKQKGKNKSVNESNLVLI